MTNPFPPGIRSVTPQLSIDGCTDAIEFYKKAIGAIERNRAPDPSGKKIWHAELQIGDSIVFVNDTFPDMGGGGPNQGQLWIYSDNVDAAYQRAVDAGMTVVMPLANMFWGDRMGTLADGWSNRWTFCQHITDLTQEEIERAGREFAAKMKGHKPTPA